MSEPLDLDAVGQAELLRKGELSAEELVRSAIGRIEALNPTLNAVVHERFERALADAADPRDGPFAGVPFLLKDLGADHAGEPAHDGNRALCDIGWRSRENSWLVERYLRAGFVVVGRSNTPEFGLVPITEPVARGAARNPWNPECSPGGSSGGSGAAVASGMVAAAHGNDGGGSIRIPASMCGVVGLKPSRGRITAGPKGDESGLSVNHVLTRSVRDSAAILDVTAGPGPGDMAVAPTPSGSFLEAARTPPGRLVVGLLTKSPAGELAPECVGAVESTAALLRELGLEVRDEHPEVLVDGLLGHRFWARWVVNASLRLHGLAEQLGRAVGRDDVEPLTWAMAAEGSATTAVDYAQAVVAGVALSRHLAHFFSEHDVLVTPTLGALPPRVGELSPPAEDPYATQGATARLVPFTTAFNMTGQPAISLPLSMSTSGLPVGVQLVARYGREDVLLSVAGALEEAVGWRSHRPRLWAGE